MCPENTPPVGCPTLCDFCKGWESSFCRKVPLAPTRQVKTRTLQKTKSTAPTKHFSFAFRSPINDRNRPNYPRFATETPFRVPHSLRIAQKVRVLFPAKSPASHKSHIH